ALFALRDSNAEGRDIESLTVELAAPERIGLQEGLWSGQERRQRALDATFERFPRAPRRLVWRDPHAQAADLAWSWQAYSHDESQFPDSREASVNGAATAGSAARKAAREAAREAAANKLAFEAANRATAVPLFGGPLDGPRSSPVTPAPTDPIAPSDPATYADLMFLPYHLDHSDHPLAAEATTHLPIPASSGRDDQLRPRLFSSRPRQHYTEEFTQEEHRATVDEARNRGHRKPATDRSELAPPSERAAACATRPPGSPGARSSPGSCDPGGRPVA